MIAVACVQMISVLVKLLIACEMLSSWKLMRFAMVKYTDQAVCCYSMGDFYSTKDKD